MRHIGNIGVFVGALLAILVLACLPAQASAQQCPRLNPAGPDVPSQVQSLTGKLIYHDGIRQWFELKLDKPKCGERSIQLVTLDDRTNALDTLRGCSVKTTGNLGIAGTGYYSLDLYQNVRSVDATGVCVRQKPLPDFSSAKPDKHISAYTVYMDVDYRPGDHPVKFQVRSAGRQLRPWQAYASYDLTGGYVLYGHCANGFDVDSVFGTRAARPLHFDDPRTPADMAEFDPETAAAAGKWDLQLGYTCVRDPAQKHLKAR